VSTRWLLLPLGGTRWSWSYVWDSFGRPWSKSILISNISGLTIIDRTLTFVSTASTYFWHHGFLIFFFPQTLRFSYPVLYYLFCQLYCVCAWASYICSHPTHPSFERSGWLSIGFLSLYTQRFWGLTYWSIDDQVDKYESIVF
jgi:hypothetical protein